MSSTTSPSILTPPPKRLPGVRRLNRVPMMIGIGVAGVCVAGVIYTAVERSNKSKIEAAQQEEAKKIEGAKPARFLQNGQAHGEVQAALGQQASQQSSPPPPPTTTQPGTPAPAPESNIVEQARAQAWQAYYQQVAQIRAHKLEMDQQAYWGGPGMDAGQGAGQGAGGFSMPGTPQQPGEAVTPPGQPQTGAAVMPGVAGISSGGTDPNGQLGKQAFLRTPSDIYGAQETLQGSVHGPKADTIMEGTAIPARLVDGINSDMPGNVTAEIETNICDSMTGRDLLIPQGTRVVGEYDISVSAGQERIGVIWHRLLFPDTSSRQIGSMGGADAAGYAGFHDQVNTHLWDKIGSSLLISIAGAGAQLAQPQASAYGGYYNPAGVASGAITQQFSQLGQAYAQRGLSIPNTIEIRPGYPFTIKANKDIPLPPYLDSRGYGVHRGACS